MTAVEQAVRKNILEPIDFEIKRQAAIAAR